MVLPLHWQSLADVGSVGHRRPGDRDGPCSLLGPITEVPRGRTTGSGPGPPRGRPARINATVTVSARTSATFAAKEGHDNGKDHGHPRSASRLNWSSTRSVDPSNITVKNITGQVALNGTVPSYPQYLEAAAAAQRVAGVTDVHNHLECCCRTSTTAMTPC